MSELKRPRLGQHFLVDESVCESIVAALDPRVDEIVLEIGPGRGALTGLLVARGRPVVAVELDDWYAKSLLERFKSPENLRVVPQDFLQLDLSSLGPGPFAVAGNLPYAVGAPILQKILSWSGWSRAVLMFQKEVALRVAATPGGADFGMLTLSTLVWAEPEIVVHAGRLCFSPPPKVDSAVVRLTRRAAPAVPEAEQPAFFRLAKAAFAQRRKMAAGTIASFLRLPRETVVAAFESLGVPATARPEMIPFSAWVALPRLLDPRR